MNFVSTYFIYAVCLLLPMDLDVTAFVLRESQRQNGDMINSLQEGGSERIWTRLRPPPTNVTTSQPRLVQKHQPLRPGDNVFEGYSCQSDRSCFHGGRCLDTGYGGSLCNCTEEWLGPQCEFLSSSMILELHLRPIVRHSFTNCLNLTGASDGVHAADVFVACKPGDTSCWVREGGPDAIKVFFWCLNTGYRMLLSEGRPSFSTRMDSYADAFRKLARRHGRRPSVDLPQGQQLPISIRLDENVDSRNGPRFTTNSVPSSPRLGVSSATSEGSNGNRFNSGRFGSLGRFNSAENVNSYNNNRRNPQRSRNPHSQNNFATSLPSQRFSFTRGRQIPGSRNFNSNSSTSQQATILPRRTRLTNLLRAAQANSGQVPQRTIQQMFRPSAVARKSSVDHDLNTIIESDPDYFAAPNVIDVVSYDMP